MNEDEEFVCFSEKQARAIECNKRILLVAAGTQYSKTTIGAIRMKLANCRHTDPSDAFIITAPTYKILQQSTLPPYLRLMDGWGKYEKKDEVFRLFTGGSVYFRTETDPDSIVGITNVRHIWGDECGKYRLYFWENMQARADFRRATIDLTTSPYSLNWVYKELIKPFKAGKRQHDLEVIQAASWENPYHSLADPIKREQVRSTMSEHRFLSLYGGEWSKMVGLVYDCFDEDQNQIEPFDLPIGTKFYGGIDWGYTHPFVLLIRAITPDGRHYQVSEFYKTGLTVPDQMKIAKQKAQVFGVECFYAGPDRPENIAFFNANGVTTQPANNDVQTGIGLHYELIKTRQFKIFKGSSPHSLDEYEVYHYPEPEDLGPDENAKDPNPVDQQNDCCDAARYLTIMTYKKGEGKIRPKNPTEERKVYNHLTELDKYFESLKKKKRASDE